MENPIKVDKLMWVKQCHTSSPSHHQIFIGGTETIPKMGFLSWFHPQYINITLW